jgi:hypothetical protein
MIWWRLKKILHRLGPRHRDHHCFRCVALDCRIQWGDVKLSFEERAAPADIDTASSASRQHFIDTGRYLRPGEAIES